MGAYAGAARTNVEPPPDAPPLPWKWATLDPLEAGRRAYRYYPTKGGCGSAVYLSLLSLLKEKVGYPWTTLPEMMMIHAAAGYAGQGTLCGALGGASVIINLAAFDQKTNAHQQLVDQLFRWYADQEFPSDRFDDIAKMPKQVRAKAMSPLCHTSLSKWALAAGEQVRSNGKTERCSKVAGEVVYKTTLALNDHFAGTWAPTAWKPSEGTAHCLQCHGPVNAGRSPKALNNQQGRLECLLCHTDHTK